MSRARKWRVGGSSHQEKDKTFPYSTPLFFFPGLSASRQACLPVVKRNGRGHRGAKRRPPLPSIEIYHDVASGVTGFTLPTLTERSQLQRLALATLFHSSSSSALSLSSTPWPDHTILLTDISG